jgi:hypothetical protein
VEGGFAVEAPVEGTDPASPKASSRQVPGPPENETAKQAARRAMFEKQAKRAGKEFLGNWYPRGKDGKNADPRIGVSTAEAPYGYVEGTTTPRTEPLYDQFGRPIIPRPKEDWFEPDVAGFGVILRDYGADRAKVWAQKVNEAAAKWGPFGDRVRMSEEDGITVTDAEYERYQEDREKAYKKKARAAEKAAKTGKMPKASKAGKPVYGKGDYEQPLE